MTKVKLLLLILAAFVISNAIGSHLKSDPSVILEKKTFRFENRVDHFDPLNEATYSQMYWIQDAYAKGKQSPVFFFLGGESPLAAFDFQEVSALAWAKQYGAYYIALEHRYYGDSNPVPDLSTNNMRYLSSEQALADAAMFVESMKQQYPGPWIVFGCSYSGSLSAWFRTKYPHLVIGSVAPSGPVIPQLNFTQFFNNFEHVAPLKCVSATANAAKQIDDMLLTSTGRESLSQMFNACVPIQPQDAFMFKWTVTEFLATTAQWENPPGNQMTQACQILTAASDPVSGWGSAFNQMNNAPGPSICTTFTEEAFLKPIQDLQLGNVDRAWYFQKCTEFGFFQVGYPGSSIFGGNMGLNDVNFCSKIFGIPKMTPNTKWTQAEYGALKLRGSNILFTNGLIDPWHTISINNHEGQVEAITYQAGHCAPMTAPTPNDPPSLVEARNRVSNFLRLLLERN